MLSFSIKKTKNNFGSLFFLLVVMVVVLVGMMSFTTSTSKLTSRSSSFFVHAWQHGTTRRRRFSSSSNNNAATFAAANTIINLATTTTTTQKTPSFSHFVTRLYSANPTSSSSSSSSISNETETETENNNNNILEGEDEQLRLKLQLQRHQKKKKDNNKKSLAKKKRDELIGLAKAVDRGQFSVTYKPGGPDGESFTALSGLPKSIQNKNNNNKESSSSLFTVLGIESSCDDTGAAVVRSDGVILGEALASQADIHEEWGGIVPNLAKMAHEENVDRIVETALRRANMTMSDVDAVGVTVGPGLVICLRVGCTKARELAMEYNKPFVGIHHLEAHVLMARLENPNLEFPFLALLVSGGHCQIMKCLGIGKYSIMGGTMDDSLGEAYDKTARLLGLPVGGGGGPAVEALAKEGNATAVPLTIPLQRRKDCDFSYAGLKTNVRRAAEQLAMERGLESTNDLSRQDKADIAASFQNIAIKHLEQRLNRAMEIVEKEQEKQQAQEQQGSNDSSSSSSSIRTLAVVGGVAANMELRKRLDALCEKRNWNMVVPPPRLCTDQGAMSAWAAIERLKLGSSDDPTNQEVYARYPFTVFKSEKN